MRSTLATRFATTVGDLPLRLPPALRESIVVAGLLEGALPEVVAAHYTAHLPVERMEQLEARHAGLALLRRPLALARLPHLREALDGVHGALRAEGLDPAQLFGIPASTAETLVSARPTLAALYAPTLFASGVPMLGAYRHQVAMLSDDLEAGCDADALLDLRLSGHIVHELCHGLAYDTLGSPPPWMVVESAVVELSRIARPAHVVPAEPGEAVAAVGLFALLGGGLARRFGRRALWQILVAPQAFTSAFGARASAVLAIAGWQDWMRRREPPFARDALEAISWVKLADACLGELDVLDHATELDPLAAARELPDLLHTCRAIAWDALPWWSEPADARDDALVEIGVHSLFAVNRFTRMFETVPDELPDGRVAIDVVDCELRATARATGAFAEPAVALFPPPLARRLHERGARRIVAEGVTRASAPKLIEALHELCVGARALDSDSVLSFQ